MAQLEGTIEDESQQIPTLEEVPATDPRKNEGHRVVYIGEVKLADFRQVLTNNGYKSDLYGGILWTCEGTISLKKVIDRN
jgi:hypothetical protein